MLEKGQLAAYKLLPGDGSDVFPDMQAQRWEQITGKKIPAKFKKACKPDPQEYKVLTWEEYFHKQMDESLPVVRDWNAKFHKLNKNQIGRLRIKDVKDLYFLRSEVETLKPSRSTPNKKPQEIISRNSTTKQKYRALARRAEIILRDLEHDNCLPATRDEKWYELCIDSEFQELVRIIKAGEKHIKRKLGVLGVWKIGKKQGKEAKKEYNKRYRTKRSRARN